MVLILLTELLQMKLELLVEQVGVMLLDCDLLIDLLVVMVLHRLVRNIRHCSLCARVDGYPRDIGRVIVAKVGEPLDVFSRTALWV